MDRGKHGSQIHLITGRTGLPLPAGTSGAHVHGGRALIPLVRGIPPIRSRRGRRHRRSGKPHRDKGYAHDHPRRRLRDRGSTPRTARKKTNSSQRLGRHRRIVERTIAWPVGAPTPHRCHGRKAIHFPALTSSACSLIRHRRLTK